MTAPLPPSLAGDYYHTNFLKLVCHVADVYNDLLTAEEASTKEAFFSLNKQSQCLYVRLIMRKGDFFRLDKIQYPEINDVANAANQLEAFGLAQLKNELPTRTALNLHTKNTWYEALLNQGVKVNKSASVSEIYEHVQRQWPENYPCPQPVIQIFHNPVWNLFSLLYFGNLHQSWPEFVISELGHRRYPKYNISKANRKFTTRSEIDECIALENLKNSLPDLRALDTKALMAVFNEFNSQAYKFTYLTDELNYLRYTIAREIERKSAEVALSIYPELACEAAIERQIRLLIKAKNYGQAKKLCTAKIAAEISPKLTLFIQTKLEYLTRKTGEAAKSKAVKTPIQTVKLAPVAGISVERLACQALQAQGDAFYVENGLFHCLFSLVYWDVIYADVPGAFTHPFQHRPHDLYSPNFLSKRSAIKQHCEHEFLHHFTEEAVFLRYNQYSKVHGLFGNWSYISLELVWRTLKTVSKKNLLNIFNHIWTDIKCYRAGLPDLILFTPNNQYQLIEVKGPGDTLQPNQRLWMKFFHAHQIPAKVLRIEWELSEEG